MQHPRHQHAPASLVIAILENLLEGMAPQRAGVVQGFLFLDRARKIPQNFLAAQLRFDFRRRRQRPRLGDSLQHDVFQFRGAVDLHRIPPVRLEFQRIRDPQNVGPGLHLWKFVLPVFIGVDRGSHAIRRDELHHHAFRRIAAGHSHDPVRPAGKAGLHRPFICFRSIPRIGRKVFSLDAALVAVQIADHVRHIRIGERGAETTASPARPS